MCAAAGRIPRLRVLLVDRHAGVRRTLRADLEEAGFGVVEAADVEAAVAVAARERPALCLLDAGLSDPETAATARLLDAAPGTRVVVTAVGRGEPGVAAAIAAGAVGYLPKDVEPARLGHVLAEVAAGRTVLPRGLQRPLR